MSSLKEDNKVNALEIDQLWPKPTTVEYNKIPSLEEPKSIMTQY